MSDRGVPCTTRVSPVNIKAIPTRTLPAQLAAMQIMSRVFTTVEKQEAANRVCNFLLYGSEYELLDQDVSLIFGESH